MRTLLGLESHAHGFTVERDHYSLLSFKGVERGFRENLTFSSEAYKEMPLVQSFGDTILWRIGDEHKRLRAVAQPMFIKPRAITWWKDNWVEEIVATLLDGLERSDKADLNFDFCARLPMQVVTQGIGLSGEDALDFRDHLLRATGARRCSPEEMAAAMGEVVRMLKELIVARREEPREDVVSGLITREIEEADGTTRKLTDEEIFSFCRLVIFAGGGTTWRQLGITIHALLTFDEFWAECVADRSLIAAAIEESLRWMPTDPVFPRLATRDVEVEGVTIPAGSRVDLCIGSANRDPARWDDPDRFDLHRPLQYHLAIGIGPHQCLGQNVARQEMVSALNALMDRFPNMRFDPDGAVPELIGGLESRGMSTLPVILR